MNSPVMSKVQIGACMYLAKQSLPGIEKWRNPPDSKPTPGPELSVIVPVFNERDNVQEMLCRLQLVLAGRSWEVIFVDDDSPDGTADVVRQLGNIDRRVRCVQRIGRRGLSSACIEGMLASTATYLAVIDGDLQHDENLLPKMLDNLLCTDTEAVIGSRHIADGGISNWDHKRARISRLATWITRITLNTSLSDPMSGLFMIRRDAFLERTRSLSGIGFKILLDLCTSGPRPLRLLELPYQFRGRCVGESKMDIRAAWDLLTLLLDKRIGNIMPIRFINFALVGALGVGVHLAVMSLLFALGNRPFVWTQCIAMLVAMTSNFTLNNILTYRDMRLRGWNWLYGLASFMLACSIGGLANIAIASYLFEAGSPWIAATLAGATAGALLNYALSSTYTWRHKSR